MKILTDEEMNNADKSELEFHLLEAYGALAQLRKDKPKGGYEAIVALERHTEFLKDREEGWFAIKGYDPEGKAKDWQIWREADSSTVATVNDDYYYHTQEDIARYIAAAQPTVLAQIFKTMKDLNTFYRYEVDENGKLRRQINLLYEIASQTKHISGRLLPSVEIAIDDYEKEFGEIEYTMEGD